METHILFCGDLPEYEIRKIAKDWHRSCNNFKGTEEECMEEGEKQKAEFLKIRKSRYGSPHYPDAPHGSIWDY